MQEEITITGAVSASSSELSLQGAYNAFESGSFAVEFGPLCYSKMINAIDQLRTMHKNRQMVTIVTGLGKYEDMAFTTLTIDRSNSPQTGGQWLQINATLRKIKMVSLKQADLPAEKATGSATGKTGTTQKTTNTSTTGDGVAGSAAWHIPALRGSETDIVSSTPVS